jgi:hypothetical protein
VIDVSRNLNRFPGREVRNRVSRKVRRLARSRSSGFRPVNERPARRRVGGIFNETRYRTGERRGKIARDGR